MSRQACYIKWWWNHRKYNWKHTQNVLHKIIYFAFRMTFQTYLWDSSLWIQIQSESHDHIRERPKICTFGTWSQLRTRLWNCVQHKKETLMRNSGRHYKQDCQRDKGGTVRKPTSLIHLRLAHTLLQCPHFAAQYFGLLATKVLVHVI